MKHVHIILLAGTIAGCGMQQELSAEALQASVGITREALEARFGRPAESVDDDSDTHPGGYWVYKLKSGGQCTVYFDLPYRVLSVKC